VKIKDARAVVTGGASGLGHAVARHVTAAGGKVVILDVQEGPGRSAAAALGKDASFVRCDVTAEAEVNAAMDAAHARLGGLNLLINCAGVVGAGRMLGKHGPMAGEFFTKVIHINLIGTFLCDKAAAAIMQNNSPAADGERGLLIHTSSVAAFEGQIGQVAYSAAKACIAGMMLTMARDLGSLGIRTVAIAPSLFSTGLTEGIPDEFAAALTKDAAFPKRMGRPEEYARLAVAIVENPMLNGSCIRLDAGQHFAPK
jgi:NAD(P)-dependent dehydrogenase (short-subunit alcohol dehydrogenase family)